MVVNGDSKGSSKEAEFTAWNDGQVERSGEGLVMTGEVAGASYTLSECVAWGRGIGIWHVEKQQQLKQRLEKCCVFRGTLCVGEFSSTSPVGRNLEDRRQALRLPCRLGATCLKPPGIYEEKHPAVHQEAGVWECSFTGDHLALASSCNIGFHKVIPTRNLAEVRASFIQNTWIKNSHLHIRAGNASYILKSQGKVD